MKSATAKFEEHIKQKSVEAGFMAYIEHPYGDVRVWSGVGTIEWNGYIWKGLGKLGKVSGTGETNQVRTSQTTYQLIGASLDDESLRMVTSSVKGKIAELYFCVFDKCGKVVADPLLLEKTRLDNSNLSMQENGDQVVSLVGHSAIFDFRKPTNATITQESQQVDFPDDDGFDRIPTEVTDANPTWTRT